MSNHGGAVIHWAGRYDLLLKVLTFGGEGRFRRRMLDLARVSAGESVLDIGCGTGTLAIAAKRRVGNGRVAGIDPSPAMIERARKKASRGKIDVQLEVAFAQELPFPDESFDVVLSTVMLHHVPKKERLGVVTEAARVTKRRGRVLLVDFGRQEGERKGLIARIHGQSGVTPKNLIDLAELASLRVIASGAARTWDLQYALAEKRAS